MMNAMLEGQRWSVRVDLALSLPPEDDDGSGYHGDGGSVPSDASE